MSEKQPQIAIDPEVHAELKEFCQNKGWLIGATTDNKKLAKKSKTKRKTKRR